jgi:hypothetical protein
LLNWLGSNFRRKPRQEECFLEQTVRSFLERYLAADAATKNEFYEVVAGAAEACQPSISDPMLQNIELAQITSDTALEVVRSRSHHVLNSDRVQSMITGAYATVAIAYRRAAAVYTMDPERQRLGTAAVHLVTMATSCRAMTKPD